MQHSDFCDEQQQRTLPNVGAIQCSSQCAIVPPCGRKAVHVWAQLPFARYTVALTFSRLMQHNDCLLRHSVRPELLFHDLFLGT